MSEATHITPFWNRIPKFFLYPLHPTSLMILVTLALAAMFFSLSLFGLLFLLLGMALFFKYAYFILEHSAQGHTEPPPLSFEFATGDYSVLIKQLLIFGIVTVVSGGLSIALGEWVAIPIFFLTAFAFPASVMILAVTNSLGSALSPAALSELIKEIGWPYLVLFAFLFLLESSRQTVSYFLADKIPPMILIAAFSFVSMYFLLIMFNMMGYVIYQYHDSLGYAVIDEQMPGETEPSIAAMHKEGDTVERFVAEGNIPAAVEELKTVIRKHPDDIELRLKFHKLIKLTDQVKQLTVHGEGLIRRLIDLNRGAQAMEVYLDCVKADAAFRPKDKKVFLPLAKTLRAHKHPAVAIRLVNGFHKLFPQDPQTPELYLLIAQIFMDDLHQDEKAKPILDFLAKHFSHHPLIEVVRSYQAALRNLSRSNS